MKKTIAILLTFCISFCCTAQNIEMKADNFEIKNPEKVEFLTYKGKKSMKVAVGSGPVEVRNLNLKDGILEFDAEATTPGFAISVYFHRKDDLEQEVVYLRLTDPEDPLANETIQYTTYLEGVNLWDMHPHYQGPAPVHLKDWNRLKLIISGKRMKVLCNGKEVLDIPELEGRIPDGKIAFEGNSYITNLTVKPDETEGLHPEALPDLTQYQSNYIREWAITSPQNLAKGREVSREDMPSGSAFKESISAERLGLVNITRKEGMSNERRVIWLKAIVESKIPQTIDLQLGFSDEIWLFLNNQLAFVDKNLFQQDMKKYPKGRLSVDNSILPLKLKEGRNEITIALANDFYGWGLIARLKSTDGLAAIEKFVPKAEVAIENIEQYLGSYKTDMAPVKLLFTKQNNQLLGQATDQQPIVFAYRGNHLFEYEKENLQLRFKPAEKQVILIENGQEYPFTRE